MRAPKGFGKRYFTLAAIQAHSGHAALQRSHTGLLARHRTVAEASDDEECAEEDDPLLTETLAQELPGGGRRRPCHCNRHFHRRACRHLRRHDRPRQFIETYRLTFSVLAPPRRHAFFTLTPNTKPIKE